MIEQHRVRRRRGLRQQNSIRRAANDRGEIEKSLLGGQRIDSHPELRASAIAMAVQIFAHHPARNLDTIGGDRVLEIEHQCVGARIFGLGEFALAVAGDKKKRAHRHCLLFFSITASCSSTSTPNVYKMPLPGRAD